MNEIIRFDIPHSEDRSSLVSILATAGYPVVVEQITDKSGLYDKVRYQVVVYGKKEPT